MAATRPGEEASAMRANPIDTTGADVARLAFLPALECRERGAVAHPATQRAALDDLALSA